MAFDSTEGRLNLGEPLAIVGEVFGEQAGEFVTHRPSTPKRR